MVQNDHKESGLLTMVVKCSYVLRRRVAQTLLMGYKRIFVHMVCGQVVTRPAQSHLHHVQHVITAFLGWFLKSSIHVTCLNNLCEDLSAVEGSCGKSEQTIGS